MTIVASCGASVVAFKQSGIVERRDVTEDLMLYMMIKIRGMLHRADGADCRRADLVHLAGPVPGGVTAPLHSPLMRGAVLPAGNRLRGLWHAVEVSVVALEQSGIVPVPGIGTYVDGAPDDAAEAVCVAPPAIYLRRPRKTTNDRVAKPK